MEAKFKEIGFKQSNISSIAIIQKHIPTVEEELLKNLRGLKNLLRIGFKPSNISSILMGSGAKCAEAIEALSKNCDKLVKLKEADFSASNISSILNGSGAKCAEAIEELYNTKVKKEF